MKCKVLILYITLQLLILTPATSEEVKLNRIQINSDLECRFYFREFGWVCDEFMLESWEKVYGKGFWGRGSLYLYRSDLDHDSYDDIIICVNHIGNCGTSGCSIFFVFGNTLRTQRLKSFSIANASLDIFLVNDGVGFS